MSAGIHRDQKRVLDSVELELQAVQDPNLGPLQKQFTLLITEPSLWLHGQCLSIPQRLFIFFY